MRLNTEEIIEISMASGDQEGRLVHKPPSKSLYESAFRERWFKLKGNLLFYYRLNGQGTVDKNEPNGLFVLENIKIEKETDDAKYPFGFSLTWKDDPYRKHYFYTETENVLQIWIAKLMKASFEMLRAELLVLRLKLRSKTGKDPLEHFGTPLPVHSIRGLLASPSKASPPSLSSSSSSLGLSEYRDEGKNVRNSQSSSTGSIHSAPTSPAHFRYQPPKPPPRVNRDKKMSLLPNSNCNIGPTEMSFKSHISDKSVNDFHLCTKELPRNNSSGSFISHVKGGLTEEDMNFFLN